MITFPISMEVRLITIVILAIMNLYVSVKKNKRNNNNQLMQDMTDNKSKQTNENGNEKIINKQKSDLVQDQYTQKLIEHQFLLNGSQQNKQQLFKPLIDKYFVKNSNQANLSKQFTEKNRKLLQQKQLNRFQNESSSKYPNSQAHQTQYSFGVTSNIINPYQDNISQRNLGNTLSILRGQDRRYLQVIGPKKIQANIIEATPMQIQQELKRKDSFESIKMTTPFNLQRKHKISKSNKSQKCQSQKLELSFDQDNDKRTVQFVPFKAQAISDCKSYLRKTVIQGKQSVRQSFKRCFKDLIFEALQQMMQKEDVQKIKTTKKKKASM